MRQQRLDRLFFLGRRRQRGELVEPVIDQGHRRRRGVERELQHGRGERDDRRPHHPVPRRGEDTPAEQLEIGERVLQEGIVALELLDQLFLAGSRRRKPIDRRELLGIAHRRVAQPAEHVVERIHLTHQGIVVAQHPGAGRERVTVQSGFEHREAVERHQRAIECLRFRIEGAHREERQQGKKKRYRGRGGRHPHRSAAFATGGVTGTPR